MVIVYRDEEGKLHTIGTESAKIMCKDNDTYRIRQDVERGLEITADGLSSKLYIEPRVTNQVTLIAKEDL